MKSAYEIPPQNRTEIWNGWIYITLNPDAQSMKIIA